MPRWQPPFQQEALHLLAFSAFSMPVLILICALAGGMQAVRSNRFLADGPPQPRAEDAVNVTPSEGYAVVTTCLEDIRSLREP